MVSKIFRSGVTGALLVLLSACADAPDPLSQDLPDMGTFQLQHNIVVVENAKVVPPSRSADLDQWQTVLMEEIERRFGAYQGGRDFHIAINVDGYSLAVPGIPIVLAPKSLLVVSANVWDDALGRKLHTESEQITVFEGGGEAVIGSGFTRSSEEQMRVLARNVAFEIQNWMLRNPAWFDLPVVAED